MTIEVLAEGERLLDAYQTTPSMLILHEMQNWNRWLLAHGPALLAVCRAASEVLDGMDEAHAERASEDRVFGGGEFIRSEFRGERDIRTALTLLGSPP